MVEKAALFVCPLDVTESHWSPAWSLRLGQEAPPFVSAVSLPLEPGNVSSHSCRPAVGVLPGPQGFSGLLVLGFGASPCSLRQKSPQPPPPAATVYAPTHLWSSALRGRLVTEVGAGQRWGHHLLSKRNVKGLMAGKRIWIYWA